MARYTYIAIDSQGKRLKDTLEASSHAEVADALLKQNYVVVDISLEQKKSLFSRRDLNTREKIAFTDNLSVLLSSGISLGEAITIIGRDPTNKAVSQFYNTILTNLESGAALSKSLAQFPNTFDGVYISLVQAGESSGHLDTIMENLAKSMEDDVHTISSVKTALMYPAFVLLALFILGILIFFFVMPRMVSVFDQLNVSLPLTTRILVIASKFVDGHKLFLAIGLVVAIIVITVFALSNFGKRFLGQLMVRIPVVKPIIHNLDLARLSTTLALLLNAGVPIQQALTIAAGTIKNPKLSQEFRAISEQLATGKNLSQALEQTSLPRTFTALVSVGEQSGKTAAIFAKLGQYYQIQLETAVKNFTAVLEPLITLMVGLLVGAVVIMIMLPIYSFIGNLQAGP